MNAATYEHPDALRDAYDDLAAAYDEIGAQWTVWVHHDDAEAAALLAERGHVLDAQPEAMTRTLASPRAVRRSRAGPPRARWRTWGRSTTRPTGTTDRSVVPWAVSRATASTCTCAGE